VKFSGNQIFLLHNKLILKNKPYSLPVLVFKKIGKYQVNINLGNIQRRINVEVKR